MTEGQRRRGERGTRLKRGKDKNMEEKRKQNKKEEKRRMKRLEIFKKRWGLNQRRHGRGKL